MITIAIKFKQKLRLKQWLKESFLISLLFVLAITSAFIFIDRVEKINKGELELVYQYGGDV